MKTPAVAFADEILGKNYLNCSANALIEDSYLRLNSPLNGIAWGIWQFSPGPRQVVSVEVTTSVGGDDAIYIAVADFAKNMWQVSGPFPGGIILPLNSLRQKSAGGLCCIGVVTAGGDAAVVHKLTLATEYDWSTITVDSDGAVGHSPSLAEIGGAPAICYCQSMSESGDPAVKYIRASDPEGAEWGSPQVLSEGADSYGFTCLMDISGKPAVSYQSIVNSPAINAGGVLWYSRANDTEGAAWGPAKWVDGDMIWQDYRGGYNSLAVIDGLPAISYRSEMYQSLRYIRAKDVDGLDWEIPQTLDESADVGFYTSLVAPDGAPPLISYYDVANGNLRGVGMNAAGTAWNPPFNIDGSADDVGRWAAGALVLNDLAVCYYNATMENLWLARYSMLAQDWVSIHVADTGEVTDVSLAVIDGNPAACYYDVEHGDLNFVRALNAGGQSWAAPQTIDSIGDVGRYCSLAEVGGLAAVSYYDAGNQDLKFAVRLGP